MVCVDVSPTAGVFHFVSRYPRLARVHTPRMKLLPLWRTYFGKDPRRR